MAFYFERDQNDGLVYCEIDLTSDDSFDGKDGDALVKRTQIKFCDPLREILKDTMKFNKSQIRAITMNGNRALAYCVWNHDERRSSIVGRRSKKTSFVSMNIQANLLMPEEIVPDCELHFYDFYEEKIVWKIPEAGILLSFDE